MFESLKRAMGLDPNENALKRYRRKVEEINALEPKIQAMSDEQILARALEIKSDIRGGAELDGHLAEVFAMAREEAKRKLGLRPFDVQLIGAMALNDANIAEMKTGEGKTLVAPIAVILNAYKGEGVHVVTVNDYLARRDANWMAPLYAAMGLSVAVIYAFMDPEERKKAYRADITYGTNSEFGFDYLRDNMVLQADEMVQRGHSYCIVDEVDSILIDEARTPLIISGPSEDDTGAYMKADQIATQLKGVFKDPNEIEVHSFLLDDKDRPEPDGDFVVDEKEKTVVLTSKGIAKCEQLLKTPGLFSDMAHADMAHKINQALKAHYLFKKDVHYVIKDGEIVIVDEFRGRLMFGRRFSDGLHQAIEAKEHVKVGKESQTLATITIQNYFRMYKKLAGMTGTAATEAEEFKDIYHLGVVVIPTNKPVIRRDWPDQVYRTMDEKFTAVVEEIEKIHAAGRPVLVGTVSVAVSEHVSKLLRARRIPHQVLNARYHEKESAIVAQAGRFNAVTVATNMAGRGTDILLGGNPDFLAREEYRAKNLDPAKDAEKCALILEQMKALCAAEKEKVLELGGLCILGTERHESRRIDNQLRGRAGRQGDPGSSRFYLSLEDDLLRLFGSDRIGGMLDKLGMEKGESIEHPLLTRAIENAQKKVEMMHYDVRRQLLLYDNVMNQQREAVYAERSTILGDPEILEHAREIAVSNVDDIIDAAFPEDKEANPVYAANKLRGIYWPGIEKALAGADDRRNVMPAVEKMKEEISARFDERVDRLEPAVAEGLFRFIALHVLDGAWKEHLLGMDVLRQGIGLRAVGQKDPLMEYQFESFNLFQETMAHVREQITQLFFRVAIVSDEDRLRRAAPAAMREHRGSAPAPSKAAAEELDFNPQNSRGNYFANYGAGGERPQPVRVKKVGRNDPCPCGSGKKYKNCCGRNL
ncbi:preprotein translocase, SecA subunit [Pyramidobacter piscolens W5455]|uniref:Protein translocase subunit SecA n=1 Tax=Pyramidobacter piscolens W5455 TaxID=352165 RepID=A0ABP2HSU5_9BACT|nr:preprotein translocase subunit SecA [Pyramidobacter piscolens]EFB90395.1 preprotein translocase, SecA subunit [Pyramidobacter piscolens W5455]